MESIPIPESISDYPLVIIDVVKGCCNREYEIPEWDIHFTKVREMLPRLNSFVKQHRDNGGRIIWVKPVPWTRENLPSNINKLYTENTDATFYVKENIDKYNEFPEAIQIEENDIIVEKNNYSAFTNPKLSELIDDSYLIAGVYADGCVNATIVEGWSRGYFTYIVKDLVESMDSETKQYHRNHLLNQTWPLMYGHVILTQNIYK